jgi:hypothetical protein
MAHTGVEIRLFILELETGRQRDTSETPRVGVRFEPRLKLLLKPVPARTFSLGSNAGDPGRSTSAGVLLFCRPTGKAPLVLISLPTLLSIRKTIVEGACAGS